MNIKIFSVNNEIFKEFLKFSTENKICSKKELQQELKNCKCFEAENINHFGHVICERLFYNISSNIEPIEFLCGNKNIDVADNSEEGFCLLSNQDITQDHIDFLEKFDFDEELSKEGINNIIKEWEEINYNITKEEILTGKKLFKVLKKSFNYAFENGYNIIWEYSK